jgi:hypothetical protein
VPDTWRVVTGDGDRKTVKKIYGPVKEEHCRIRRNNEIKDTGPVTRGRYSKMYKIPPTKMVGSY